jgi:hypothetical protein
MDNFEEIDFIRFKIIKIVQIDIESAFYHLEDEDNEVLKIVQKC